MAEPGNKKKPVRRRVLFALEMVLLLVFLAVLFFYGQVTSRLKKMGSADSEEYNSRESVKNETAPVMTGYRTYAVFGIDHRSKNEELDTENSDTIIIVSINNDTSDVKLVSVYRDTLMYIGDDLFDKANSAYAYGGPIQAVNMLNANLDLDITDYVAVDFSAVAELVDAVGGIEVPLSYAEIVHLNNYCEETAAETGKSYEPIPLPEPKPEDEEAIIDLYHVNGVQATSYCRIRYTASLDMGRTERQRRVIQLVTNKLKTSGVSSLFNIMDAVFPLVKTSLTATEILSMVPTLLQYSLNDTTGFPMNYRFSEARGSSIVADTLESNVIELHNFLYGEEQAYTPTTAVLQINDRILKIVDGEAPIREEQSGIRLIDATTVPDEEHITIITQAPDGLAEPDDSVTEGVPDTPGVGTEMVSPDEATVRDTTERMEPEMAAMPLDTDLVETSEEVSVSEAEVQVSAGTEEDPSPRFSEVEVIDVANRAVP